MFKVQVLPPASQSGFGGKAMKVKHVACRKPTPTQLDLRQSLFITAGFGLPHY